MSYRNITELPGGSKGPFEISGPQYQASIISFLCHTLPLFFYLKKKKVVKLSSPLRRTGYFCFHPSFRPPPQFLCLVPSLLGTSVVFS